MQKALFRVWTRGTVSISYVGNHYATSASLIHNVCIIDPLLLYFLLPAFISLLSLFIFFSIISSLLTLFWSRFHISIFFLPIFSVFYSLFFFFSFLLCLPRLFFFLDLLSYRSAFFTFFRLRYFLLIFRHSRCSLTYICLAWRH